MRCGCFCWRCCISASKGNRSAKKSDSSSRRFPIPETPPEFCSSISFLRGKVCLNPHFSAYTENSKLAVELQYGYRSQFFFSWWLGITESRSFRAWFLRVAGGGSHCL